MSVGVGLGVGVTTGVGVVVGVGLAVGVGEGEDAGVGEGLGLDVGTGAFVNLITRVLPVIANPLTVLLSELVEFPFKSSTELIIHPLGTVKDTALLSTSPTLL